MAGEEDDAASTASANKSKQERIRDNQRRSRARRQEHLADLERRLADCHTTCRDAELQKQAFKDLQIENARLRELLSLAGIESSLVESYVYQRINRAQAGDGRRHIRPKISMDANGQPAPTFDPSLVPKQGSLSPYSDSSAATRSGYGHDPSQQAVGAQMLMPSLYSSVGAYAESPRSMLNSTSALGSRAIHGYNRVQENLPRVKPEPRSSSSFCCDTFKIAPNGPLQATSENTILCSVAKDMIDQYIINDEDMERIKSRLATGFRQPAFPGQGCRVNNQLLFEVLNEVSSRLP